jgi:hypothetical protein
MAKAMVAKADMASMGVHPQATPSPPSPPFAPGSPIPLLLGGGGRPRIPYPPTPIPYPPTLIPYPPTPIPYPPTPIPYPPTPIPYPPTPIPYPPTPIPYPPTPSTASPPIPPLPRTDASRRSSAGTSAASAPAPRCPTRLESQSSSPDKVIEAGVETRARPTPLPPIQPAHEARPRQYRLGWAQEARPRLALEDPRLCR